MKTKEISTKRIPDVGTPEGDRERSYRRGAHQAIGITTRKLEKMPETDRLRFLHELTTILSRFRRDGKEHRFLVDEAIEEAERRMKPRKGGK